MFDEAAFMWLSSIMGEVYLKMLIKEFFWVLVMGEVSIET